MSKERIIIKSVKTSLYLDLEGNRMPFNNELSQLNEASSGFLRGFLNVIRNILFIENEDDNSVGLLKYQEERAHKLKRTPAEAIQSVPRYQNHNNLDTMQSPGKAHLSNFMEKIR